MWVLSVLGSQQERTGTDEEAQGRMQAAGSSSNNNNNSRLQLHRLLSVLGLQ